ncbi:Phosphatidate cytidylyltransferase, partial [Globisporangium splendens]
MATKRGGGVDWRRRILTLVVGVPTALKLLSSDAGMLLLVVVVCALCLVEFRGNICAQIVPSRHHARLSHHVLLVAAGTLMCAAAWTGDKDIHDATMALVALAVVLYHLLHTTKLDHQAMTLLLLDLFALVYIVSGLSHAVLLRYVHREFGMGLQIMGVVSAWVCDSGALVAGAFFGHAKLAPAISPGKTMVGALAGVASSVATVLFFFALPHLTEALPFGGALQHFLPVTVSLGTQVALGVVVGVLCILGDLVESYMKRVAGVKDSGRFFPGHGGCLDRMDSVLLTAPFLYFYAKFAL